MAHPLIGDRTRCLVQKLLTIALMVLFIGNCASIAAKSRVEKFYHTAKAYEWALESGNYRDAAKHLDASAARGTTDFKRYANIRVSRYTITHANVSQDQLSVRQDVELQYYLVDQSIVKITMDRQVWHFNEAGKEWLLQTGLPAFP